MKKNLDALARQTDQVNQKSQTNQTNQTGLCQK